MFLVGEVRFVDMFVVDAVEGDDDVVEEAGDEGVDDFWRCCCVCCCLAPSVGGAAVALAAVRFFCLCWAFFMASCYGVRLC